MYQQLRFLSSPLVDVAPRHLPLVSLVERPNTPPRRRGVAWCGSLSRCATLRPTSLSLENVCPSKHLNVVRPHRDLCVMSFAYATLRYGFEFCPRPRLLPAPTSEPSPTTRLLSCRQFFEAALHEIQVPDGGRRTIASPPCSLCPISSSNLHHQRNSPKLRELFATSQPTNLLRTTTPPHWLHGKAPQSHDTSPLCERI